MWYEIEMFPEYIQSCVQMMAGIENPENATFHFCFNLQERLEKIDWESLREKYPSLGDTTYLELTGRFKKILSDHAHALTRVRTKLIFRTNNDDWYNIAKYRRDLNHNYCDRVDYVLWGETDSLWPKQTLEVIELLDGQIEPKNIISFASRVNWDASWNITRHPLYQDIQFQDNDEWTLNNEASEKSYMTLDRMNQINDIPLDELEILELQEPKADGSCLVISSELIKSGVNIPHALLHCGEDESFLRMAKLVMGSNFRQYLVKNILRVHNRRHPRKRMYIKGENNPRGFCDDRKGPWWRKLENASKFNLEHLRNQVRFNNIEDVI